MKNISDPVYDILVDQERGAVEAGWAHNSEVGRSKLLAAIHFFFFFLFKWKKIYNDTIYQFYYL